MTTITFNVGIAMRPPIEPDRYRVREFTIDVSFPDQLVVSGMPLPLPEFYSTMFVVAWEDTAGTVTAQLRSQGYERHLPRFLAFEAISELLLAFKLVRVGHADGQGVRTIGVADTLFYFSFIDGVPSGDLNVALKADRGAPWKTGSQVDPKITTTLALPHIGTDTLPMAKRYVRCYELLDHGFHSEAFVVAFSILDDFVQQTLHQCLERKGILSRDERDDFLRGIKENRLKIYLGPLLKLVSGNDLQSMWTGSKAALDWLNKTRNRIAHAGQRVNHADAAKGIFVCLKTIVLLVENGVSDVELTVELFRHAKITAAWTANPPSWIPSGEVSESLDFRS